MYQNSIARQLEKALQIALQRAHGGDASRAAMLGDWRYWSIIPSTCNRAWQDALRLTNQLEAVEAAEGVEHVRVKPSSPSYLDQLYSLPSQELTGLFRMALDQGDPYTADLIRDILHVRETLGSSVCPSCGGSGRWGDDIPCGRCGGWGQ